MKEIFSCAHTVSNFEKNTDQERIKYLVREKLTRQLAAHIGEEMMKEEVGEFSTTYMMRLVVADTDHFWRCVQQEAMQLQSRFSMPVWVKEA